MCDVSLAEQHHNVATESQHDRWRHGRDRADPGERVRATAPATPLTYTPRVQGTLTFVIASSMVHVDMRKGTVAAFPYPWPDQSFAVVQLRDGDPEKATTKRGRVWRTCHQTYVVLSRISRAWKRGCSVINDG